MPRSRIFFGNPSAAAANEGVGAASGTSTAAALAGAIAASAGTCTATALAGSAAVAAGIGAANAAAQVLAQSNGVATASALAGAIAQSAGTATASAAAQVLAASTGTSTATGLAGSVAQAAGTSTADAIQAAFMRPASDIATGGWLPSSGSTLWETLTAQGAPYIYSPDNPTTQQFEVLLSTGVNPGGNAGRKARYELEATGLDTAFDFDLVQGTSVLDSWTENVTVAEGVVVRVHTFSGAVIDTLTNYADARIRGVARAP
jgi:hypothetical protein